MKNLRHKKNILTTLWFMVRWFSKASKQDVRRKKVGRDKMENLTNWWNNQVQVGARSFKVECNGKVIASFDNEKEAWDVADMYSRNPPLRDKNKQKNYVWMVTPR